VNRETSVGDEAISLTTDDSRIDLINVEQRDAYKCATQEKLNKEPMPITVKYKNHDEPVS